ncbi:hypothetical protein GCM10028806_50720 [Spirosoma terrae]
MVRDYGFLLDSRYYSHYVHSDYYNEETNNNAGELPEVLPQPVGDNKADNSRRMGDNRTRIHNKAGGHNLLLCSHKKDHSLPSERLIKQPSIQAKVLSFS